jgi:hypothetical protein
VTLCLTGEGSWDGYGHNHRKLRVGFLPENGKKDFTR